VASFPAKFHVTDGRCLTFPRFWAVRCGTHRPSEKNNPWRTTHLRHHQMLRLALWAQFSLHTSTKQSSFYVRGVRLQKIRFAAAPLNSLGRASTVWRSRSVFVLVCPIHMLTKTHMLNRTFARKWSACCLRWQEWMADFKRHIRKSCRRQYKFHLRPTLDWSSRRTNSRPMDFSYRATKRHSHSDPRYLALTGVSIHSQRCWESKAFKS